MRVPCLLPLLVLATTFAPAAQSAEERAAAVAPEETVARFFREALAHGRAYQQLEQLVTQYPGRLAGSKALEAAVRWAEQALHEAGADRVYTQDVMVPHWERGAPESVRLQVGDAAPQPLAASALGGSVATPAAGLTAAVIEVASLDALAALGAGAVAGKIVFFNRPMDPAIVRPGTAYGQAADQRSRGPAAAARLGAVGALTRSLTHARDDVPHTGSTTFPPGAPRIPCAALSTLAADRLSAALRSGQPVRVTMQIDARWLPDAPSHNVIGEIRGRVFPDRIILVGGHLDSWDISPGAHDNGSGVVQAIEVLRLFRTLGIQPRHTLRCVLFTNEENGVRGSVAYSGKVKSADELHVFAVESDNGGFQPRGFNLGSTQGDVHLQAAAKWRHLFEPYGLFAFVKGTGGVDVGPLMAQGVTVAGLMPDSQRYFDYHHTREDSLDKVNPRELHLGAAAIAALVWLVDTQGL